ncbi:SEC-C domain-containing protein [Arthrobacter sp. LAR12-1-1.1]
MMGYTGLAIIGKKSQPTIQVLMDLMYEALEEAELDFGVAVERFRLLLTAAWNEPRIRHLGPATARLSIVLTGFQLFGEGKYKGPYQWLITNYQELGGKKDHELAWPEFQSYVRAPQDDWPMWIYRIGEHRALPTSEAETIRERLAEGIPPQAVKDSMLNLLPRQSATHPIIGTRANAVTLRPYGEPEGSYHSYDGGVHDIGSFDRVVVEAPGEMFMVSSLTVKRASPGAKFVTEVPMRQPCPCGSGLEYRRCHGKTPFKAPEITFRAAK